MIGQTRIPRWGTTWKVIEMVDTKPNSKWHTVIMDDLKLQRKRARQAMKRAEEMHNGKWVPIHGYTDRWDRHNINGPIKGARLTFRVGAKPNKETRDHNRKAFAQMGYSNPTNRELETGNNGYKLRKPGRHPRHQDPEGID